MSEYERRVVKAAYQWRYALVTPGSDLDVAERELVDAVDEYDVNRPHREDAGPVE